VCPKWAPEASACVVMASAGYPGHPKTGVAISGIQAVQTRSRAVVFHAGTKREGNMYYTSGGRVLMVSANGHSLAEARASIYDAASSISFEGAHFRRDIAGSQTQTVAS